MPNLCREIFAGFHKHSLGVWASRSSAVSQRLIKKFTDLITVCQIDALNISDRLSFRIVVGRFRTVSPVRCYLLSCN